MFEFRSVVLNCLWRGFTGLGEHGGTTSIPTFGRLRKKKYQFKASYEAKRYLKYWRADSVAEGRSTCPASA